MSQWFNIFEIVSLEHSRKGNSQCQIFRVFLWQKTTFTTCSTCAMLFWFIEFVGFVGFMELETSKKSCDNLCNLVVQLLKNIRVIRAICCFSVSQCALCEIILLLGMNPNATVYCRLFNQNSFFGFDQIVHF